MNKQTDNGTHARTLQCHLLISRPRLS